MKPKTVKHFSFYCAFVIQFVLFHYLAMSQSQNEPTTINWNPTSNKVLGLGVDLNNIDKWNPPAFTYKADTFKMGVSGETQLHIIENEEQLFEALGFEAGIAARNLTFNIESKFGINKESISNSYNLNLILSAKEYYDLIMVHPDSIRLTDMAKYQIKHDFKNIFGSYYIGAVRTGSMIAIIITIKTESTAVKEQLTASLKGSYKTGLSNGSGYANFNKLMNDKKDNIHIDMDVKYWGIQTNDEVKKLIGQFDNFKTGTFDPEKILHEAASILSSMGSKSAVPLILSLSSFNTLDTGLHLDQININDDYLNYKLSVIQKDYFKTKEKLKQVLDLNRREDINYQEFFKKDSIKEINGKRDTSRVFNDSLMEIYNKYAKYLNDTLDTLISRHAQCTQCKKPDICCKYALITHYWDTINIPSKYTSIYQSPPEEIPIVTNGKQIGEGKFWDITISNLRPNAVIQIKCHIEIYNSIPSIRANLGIYCYLNDFNNVKDTIANESFANMTSKTLDKMIYGKADSSGNLKIKFHGYMNLCASNSGVQLEASSYILVEYKNK